MARIPRSSSGIKSGGGPGRFYLTVFPGLSMEHSWQAFSPIWVSTKSRQFQSAGWPPTLLIPRGQALWLVDLVAKEWLGILAGR
jgi:hypothetical protein